MTEDPQLQLYDMAKLASRVLSPTLKLKKAYEATTKEQCALYFSGSFKEGLPMLTIGVVPGQSIELYYIIEYNMITGRSLVSVASKKTDTQRLLLSTDATFSHTQVILYAGERLREINGYGIK